MVSAVTWNLLSEEDRKIIQECSSASAEYERMLWTAREEEARARVLSQGCTELTLSGEEKKKFHDAMKPLYLKYCENYMDIVEQIREMGAE
jgi:TRAP-type C4-dicarboxylate transport system substrate-binding protein